ncbi:hypothetical protein COR50_15145 [Chitinophaga caeni]|uniref:Putative carbohydrate metabolism domain-containing protein n=2 Tax=Chitinophaga caeni TaxID=2029983 RepID=A0A291QWU7_9BACT|nr:hypothetical protein COR50_15145 [Chitinophaga caeni]
MLIFMKRSTWLCWEKCKWSNILYGFTCIVTLQLSSCIKDAPLNPEADIESFVVDSSLTTGDVFIDQANSKIMLYLKESAYESGLAPSITVSDGATVSPATGDSIHFNQPITYTVTSASKTSTKVYKVEVVQTGTWDFDFEYWDKNERDQYEFPVEEDGTVLWSSGNPGVALSGVPKRPDAYPLRQTTDSRFGNTAAELVTLKGTTLSSLFGVKLFAGSLFLGIFDSQNALLEPLKATRFGQPISKGIPEFFTGYYKYTPGENFQDKDGNILPGITDSCALYAVIYSGTERLDATNIHNSPRIIATAYLPDGSRREAYTHFSIPFTYIRQPADGDDFMLTIVASSSRDGDQYRGAIGSRLVVDSLSIKMKP